MVAQRRLDQLVYPAVAELIRECVGPEYLQEVRGALEAAEKQEERGRVGDYLRAAKDGARVLKSINNGAKQGVSLSELKSLQVVVDNADLLSKGVQGVDPAAIGAGGTQARVAQQAAEARGAAGGGAGAAQQASQASRILGGIGGGIAIASGLVEIGGGIWKFASDHPEVRNAKVFHARILSLAMQLGEKLSQPDAEVEMWRQTLGTSLRSSYDLISRLRVYRYAEGTADVFGGGAGVAGGVIVVISAAGGPVIWAVGTTVLGAFGAAYGACKTVGISFRDYSIRQNFWDYADVITGIRRSAGLLPPLAKLCTLVFEGSNACQCYMIIEYCAFDGTPVTLLSCDRGDYNWYGGTFPLEPGITNLKVAFSVRGAGDVCAVDRRQAAMPWRRGEDGRRFQEVFTFGKPDGSRFTFELCGTCFDRHVSRATVWHGVGRREETLAGQPP